MSDFYRAFEDRHRGSRALIKSRLAAYRPFLDPLLALQPALPHPAALDLGCGRGEWLELLGELGLDARGVDLDEGMLAACRERGLKVTTADALATLRAQPDASLALVSAFHLVEHIPFDDVQELVRQALRVLQPGGLLIMETPNPENLVVASTNFYTDPSHLRPVPPLLLDFAVEFAGFARHKVVRLQESAALREAPSLELVNVLDGVSPDYSVVGQKAADGDVLAAFDAAFALPFGLELGALARRYDEGLRARDMENAAALARLEERVVAAEQAPAELFVRALETVAQVHAAGRVSDAELLAGQERERALRAQLQAQAEAATQAAAQAAAQAAQGALQCAQLGQELEQLRAAHREAEARCQQAREQLGAMTARAAAAEQSVQALRASTSWKVSAPLRLVKDIGLGIRRAPGTPVGQGRQAAGALLQWSIRKVRENRRLAGFALGVLARYPGLKARLRRAAVAAAYAPDNAGAAPAPAAGAPDGAQLPARAARLLDELRRAAGRKS